MHKSSYRQREVAWYRANGKHPERVVIGGDGDWYVVGDDGWNDGINPSEFIEKRMAAALDKSARQN